MRFTIIQDLMFKFEPKMKSFAKKFSKNGQGNYTYIQSEPYICEDKSDPKFGYWVVDVDIEAFYKLGDYKFVAALEWVEEANENLIKKISNDIYVPEIYKTRRECDHCKSHRYRKSTILLVNSQNEYIQVGKSCVKEYTGIDIGNYASYLAFFSNIEEYLQECEKDNSSNFKREYEVDEVLQLTLEDVKRYGYVSKRNAFDYGCDSTAYKITLMMVGGIDYESKKIAYPKYEEISEESYSQVKEIKDFYKDLESNEDYINNIKTLLKCKWIKESQIPLLVSAVGTKLRIEKEKKENENKPKSQFIGKIGDRITFISVPEIIYTSESPYGVFYIYKMDVDGNEVIWKTSKSLEANVKIEFTATIKAHEIYKEVNQTEITRARTKRIF